MNDNTLDDLTFEQAFTQLEETVTQLDSGDLSLEESVTLYERGVALSRRCGEMLDAAELRVQQISEDGEILA